MKPEIKQRWIEALRSDEYAQSESVLHQATNLSYYFAANADVNDNVPNYHYSIIATMIEKQL